MLCIYIFYILLFYNWLLTLKKHMYVYSYTISVVNLDLLLWLKIFVLLATWLSMADLSSDSVSFLYRITCPG